MQKQQTITNRHKKASDGQTSKASNLKVIQFKGKTSMSNSNAVRQINQDVSGLANEASRVAQTVNKYAYAIRAIGDVLESDLRTKDQDYEGLNNNVLGGVIAAIQLSGENLNICGNELGNALVKGGFSHE